MFRIPFQAEIEVIPIPSKLMKLTPEVSLINYFKEMKKLNLSYHPFGDPSGTFDEDLPEYISLIKNHDIMWEKFSEDEILESWNEVNEDYEDEFY